MEMKNPLNKMSSTILKLLNSLKTLFIKKSEVSEKRELNFTAFKILFASGILIFIGVTMLLPNDQEVEFIAKLENSEPESQVKDSTPESSTPPGAALKVWNAGDAKSTQGMGGTNAQINYNTSMILGSKNGNAKTQLRAGTHVALRILDKILVSQDSVPILAESILDSTTDSGLKLPSGTRFYGEANFQKGSERASISFRQISLSSGEIKTISGLALGKDGQPGIPGLVYSDGLKNTVGAVITTFVAGYASGSMETDLLGNSKGGVENGLKAAVSATAKNQAQNYGEKLKTQREWIEVPGGTECDALLNETIILQQNGGDQ